jgi:hypothetical protein
VLAALSQSFGCATASMDDGTIHELRTGMLFYIPPGPPGHDSWVVGDAPYSTFSGHSDASKH